MTTNDELVALILPWAKERHPDKYQATIAVAGKAATFRRYLIRLVEIRWADDTEDKAWRGAVPLDVLEDSAIALTARHRPSGRTLEVRGRLAPGPRTWSFAELASLTEDPSRLELLATAKEVLDLEHVPADAPPTRASTLAIVGTR